jgi:hypothetical protein
VVLAHECICHVVDLGRGIQVDNGNVFSEGMMDWCAGYQLRRWLPSIWPGGYAGAVPHVSRFTQLAVATVPRRRSARIVGWAAADELVAQLMGVGLALPDAESRVADFAVRMSVSDRSLDAKHALVQRIEANSVSLATLGMREVLLDDEDPSTLF